MAQIYPLHILNASLAGLVNRRQRGVLEYPIEENRVLKEQFKGRALLLIDEQRRRLAAKGKRLGRRLLMQVATIVTPDTLLRWHRRLIAAKWTYTSKRVGRPEPPRARRRALTTPPHGLWSMAAAGATLPRRTSTREPRSMPRRTPA